MRRKKTTFINSKSSVTISADQLAAIAGQSVRHP
jgi:hypothetical protein